jgi:hypothetical protein
VGIAGEDDLDARNVQLEYINSKVIAAQAQQQPVVAFLEAAVAYYASLGVKVESRHDR